MAFDLADNIKETTTATGSPMTLAGAATGYKAFSTFLVVGDTTIVSIRNSTDFETGLWQYTSANTLTRVTVYESTNGNAAVAWGGGSKDVICGPLARRSLDLTFTPAMLQVNGCMDVSQENSTLGVTLTTATSAYIIDMWRGRFVRAATLAIQCGQVTPPGSPSFQGAFQFALQIKATTGLGSLATGDYGYLEHMIEGYRCARINFGASAASPVTVGFWVYATIAGTMTVALINNGLNRSIPVNVVINSATTWEYKVVTFAGDVTGTWLDNNGVGLAVRFCFGAGATWQGTNNTWAAAEVFATSATTNFFATTNNLACITGVSVLPGIEAPSADRSLVMLPSFDEELYRCMRYWEKSYDYSVALAAVTNVGLVQGVYALAYGLTGFPFKAKKRAIPTVLGWDGAGSASVWKRWNDSASGSITFNAVSENGVRNVSVTGATDIVEGHYTANARL